ncbi:protein CBFA2T1-like isoform X2 [Physella acuta]|uniref:protein CBFA2T1-like isoform X2 n=1 Tax=Physella acuta TaxID=109671 RepID=UPI0027DB0EC2|nr:protein CBFA2T1-like isoform X2 [Physella acuta]XP_059177229.1 protein CBFA2T1-like isoform X2 [Physella acuta]XP_059177230.1 protein CBFA2T1-like isoform X2 [Physella acuta]
MITYFRECAMPDSPDIKPTPPATLSPKTGNMTGLPPATRPLSSNSSISGVNGSHSPHSTMNGRTPSPPLIGSLMNSSSGQQLPPACGARQLSKLKRFLTTLQQFGSDISPEIGERVRTLVLGLVNSHLSIEEFHAKLQEATNFPLRPFVIPFLKANLPLLQRELVHCARMAKQTPQQFLTQNEHIVFDPTHSPLDTQDSVMSEINENGKRCSPDKSKENGLDLHLDSPHPAKRHHGSHQISPVSSSRVSPGSTFNLSTGPIRLEDISKSREMRERMEREQLERERTERERDRHFTSYSFRSSDSLDHMERLDDDWRHVETMLNCIIGMVDKTKRALSVLQERSVRDREELSLWARRQADGIDADVKKRSGDVMAFTLRQTEERVSEVRRRAEEAVNDVKRQAMLELQKAVSAADQKAADLVAAERLKMERAINEARKQTHSDLLLTLSHQEESAESCWNCGRKASETCSGCNVARYCGSFCQHKDWENHHHVCGKAHITSVAEARELRRAALASAAAAAASINAPSSSATAGKDLAPSSKGLSADAANITCVSPTPSVVPSLSTKESSKPTATSTGIVSPSSPSHKSSSPTNSNPGTPDQDNEATVVSSESSA